MARRKWSQDVTEHSNALDLEAGVFTKDELRKAFDRELAEAES